MPRNVAVEAARACLAVCLVLGLATIGADLVWPAVVDAASVDVILTPTELQDRRLIDVVYRTHRFDRSRREPNIVLGLATATAAAVGLFASRGRRVKSP